MTFISGTTLEIPFIPRHSVKNILAITANMQVLQIEDALFGPHSIDTAVLKILSTGENASLFGVIRLKESEHAAYPIPEAVVTLRLPVALVNFAHEFVDYAAHYYSTPETLTPTEAIIHAICDGELCIESEAFLDPDGLSPLSYHTEIKRRAEITKAHETYQKSPKSRENAQ